MNVHHSIIGLMNSLRIGWNFGRTSQTERLGHPIPLVWQIKSNLHSWVVFKKCSSSAGNTGLGAESHAARSSHRYAKGYDPDNWLLIDPATAEIRLQKQPDRESPFLVNGIYYAKILSLSQGKLCLWTAEASTMKWVHHTQKIYLLCQKVKNALADLVYGRSFKVNPDNPTLSQPQLVKYWRFVKAFGVSTWTL